MAVDGSDLPLGALNISLKFPLVETQQLMMNRSLSFSPSNATRKVLVHLFVKAAQESKNSSSLHAN